MEIFRPEIPATMLGSFLEVARGTLGEQELQSLLHELGTNMAEISDRHAWVSLRFVEAFVEALVERAGDLSLVDRAARLSFSPRYLGVLYPFFRAFGTPAFTYSEVVRNTPRFNKVGRYRITQKTRSSIRLVYSSRPEAPRERSPLICQGRASQLATIPVLFGRPPAQVDHPRCMIRGDDACIYDIRWKEPPRQLLACITMCVGLAAGTALGMSVELAGIPWLLVVAGFAIAGWTAGRNSELRRAADEALDDLIEHRDALLRSTRAQEDRFAELLEAKAETERKVEQRTAELQKTSTRLAQTLEELQALNRAQTDFFNNVSHELRSPLTLLVAPLRDLAAGEDPPGGSRMALQSMERNATRLLRLIDQLLDLAKIDAGEMRLRRSEVDPVALARRVVGAFEQAAKTHHVRLSLEAPESLPGLLLDEGWIESALTNLIANAMRFVERDGSIVVRVGNRGGDAVLEVRDDGPGMPAEDARRVFERFSQGQSTTSHAGTGLGLAIVREAARLHGGEARVQSAPGEGACFTLTLPRVVEDSAQAATTASAQLSPTTAEMTRPAAASNEETYHKSGPSESSATVVVAEDNPDLRRYIVDVLSTRYHVRAFESATRALEEIDAIRPHAVVSDVVMPGMDGYALCRALRANEHTRPLPIILVTARGELSNVLEGFSAGATDYLAKPFHGSELLARVDVHVELHRMMKLVAQQERLVALGVLAASVAHQTRNPLTTMISGLPALRRRLKDHLDASDEELFDVMLDCADRIERLTRDLLDLSRIDRSETGVFRPGSSLAACVRLIRARVSPSIVIDDDIDTRTEVQGRSADTGHVFLNLIDNAVLAVGEKGRVTVRGFAEANGYCCEVEDSGPGIPEEDLLRIYDPFFTTRRAGEGTGLGLSIVKRVVDQHGGHVAVTRSTLGGARFRVWIPTGGGRSLEVPSRPPSEHENRHQAERPG